MIALAQQALTEQALAGQALAAQSLTGQSLAKSGGTRSPELLAEFALGFVKVCEGQAYDKEFEKRDKVTLSEYIEMIDLKTAKVLETAAVLGVIASGDYTYIEALRTFAHHVGIAFQIQDDLLDLTAEDAEFGKTIGGDILEGKRTYLLLKLVERQASLSAEARDRIDRILAGEATAGDIDPIRSTMQQSGVLRETEDAVQEHTTLALQALDEIGTDTSRLRSFAGWLLKRSH